MADEITDILLTAWRRVREQLRGKPAEVAGRMKRGRDLWRKRPPRAWCLAVRAADARITPVTARCVPEDAAYPREAMAPQLRTSSYARHTVTLDVALLRELCAPVRVHEWGEGQAEVARRLGRREAGLVVARATGRLRTNFHPPTGGHGGVPRAIVVADGALDPGAHLFQPADRVWGWTGRIAPWRVPDELPPQVVERVPFYQDRTRAYADTSALHPEHPLADPMPRKRPSYKLAKPPPDYVAYKWRGEAYVGYDWRAAASNPLIRANYERHQRKLARQRACHQARRARGAVQPRAGAGGGGSLLFRGWMWICPICGKRKKVLYYPLPPVNVVRGYGAYVADAVIDAAIAREPSLGEPLRARGLGCKQCHGVRWTSRVNRGVWHEVVQQLSGGLLRGSEAPRPAWFAPQRKRPFRPCLGRAPSRRLPQVQAMMLRGLTYAQIAAELGLRESTVSMYAWKLCVQHGLRGRPELLRKLRAAEPPTPPDPPTREAAAAAAARGEGEVTVRRGAARGRTPRQGTAEGVPIMRVLL